MMAHITVGAEAGVSLEPFTESHIHRTFSWVSNPTFRSLFLLRGDVTWEGHVAYFLRVLRDPSQRIYAIFHQAEHVGNCGFKHLDAATRSGEIWIYIGSSEMRGKGIGYRATQLLLCEGVEKLGLEKIHLHVAANNESARKLYLRSGFVEVGEVGEEWQGREAKVLRMVWERKRA